MAVCLLMMSAHIQSKFLLYKSTAVIEAHFDFEAFDSYLGLIVEHYTRQVPRKYFFFSVFASATIKEM